MPGSSVNSVEFIVLCAFRVRYPGKRPLNPRVVQRVTGASGCGLPAMVMKRTFSIANLAGFEWRYGKAIASGKHFRFDRRGDDCLFGCLAGHAGGSSLEASAPCCIEHKRIRQWPAVAEVMQCLVWTVDEFGVAVADPYGDRRCPVSFHGLGIDRHVARPIRDAIVPRGVRRLHIEQRPRGGVPV